MFNVEEFQEYPRLKNIVVKTNKLITKNKITKLSKIIEELEDIIEENDLLVPATYILSIFTENYVDLIPERLIRKIRSFINSDNQKLRINSISIIGFFINANPEYLKEFISDYFNLLVDKNEDIRDNSHYFLHGFIEIDPDILASNIDILLKSLSIESKDDNLISLLMYLNKCESFDFKQLYKFRESTDYLINLGIRDKNSELYNTIIRLIKKHFPSLEETDFNKLRRDDILKLIDSQFLMKKFNFSEVLKEKNWDLKKFIANFKKTRLKDEEIYFYIKNKEKNDFSFYEFEKDKLINYFNKNDKLSLVKIRENFSQVLESESELKKFVKMLINLGIIKGYLSKFYFYPHNYLKNDILNKFQNKGIVNLKNYDFLPAEFVHNAMNEIETTTKQQYLLGKTGKVYYSLNNILKQIKDVAAKKSSIDLKAYQERLSNEDFIKLIKNLPQEYLTKFHKSTSWLTNIGRTRIKTELDNSKIIGYIDVKKIIEKLIIRKALLIDVINLEIDPRSGVWDKTKEKFYYSKYLKDRIEQIDIIAEEEEKARQINLLARELNIEKDHIIRKIDENLQLIGDEIKNQDQIKVGDYLEKTGMEYEKFIDFIHEIGLNYFKKGENLILNPDKIEDAKISIKRDLIEKSKSLDYISLGTFDITGGIIEDLIIELQSETKLKGIFYELEDELVFYTENGLKNLMLENSHIFLFEDLLYGKVPDEQEKQLLREILQDLMDSNKLKGDFDEDTLTFTSNELIFAKGFTDLVDDFGSYINNYLKIFNSEFKTIRTILLKRNEIIYPQEIKKIQDIIERIQRNVIKWKIQLESFEYKSNKKILKDQGYTMKRYEGLPISQQNQIQVFKDNPEVIDYKKDFDTWVDLFNKIELKYGQIIFLQKRLIKNPDNDETQNELEELIYELNLN